MSRRHVISWAELKEMEERMWKALSERKVLGHGWKRGGINDWFICDPDFSFSAGNLISVSVTAGKSFWLHVRVAGKGYEGELCDIFPKALVLRWNRSARETAHNVLAIVQLVADTIEKREACA